MRPSVPLLSALVVVASAMPVSAGHATQTVTGRIAAPATSPDAARVTWHTSKGLVNGVTGYVFPVDPSTVGGRARIEVISHTPGVRPTITFFDDMRTGEWCGSSNVDFVLRPCGRYGIVTIDVGIDVAFAYSAWPPGIPQPAPSPESPFDPRPRLPVGACAGSEEPEPAWLPPPDAIPGDANHLYLDGTAGHEIAFSVIRAYTSGNALIELSGNGPELAVNIRGDQSWSLRFELAATCILLEPGFFGDLSNEIGAIPPRPTIRFSGEGRGCQDDLGWLAIDDVAYDWHGNIERIEFRFSHRCGPTGAPLFGAARWSAYDVPAYPDPGPPPDWQPSSEPVDGTFLSIESAPGDSIGRGVSEVLTEVSVVETEGLLEFETPGPDAWKGQIKLPDRYPHVRAGHFPGVLRYPFHNPVKGGLTIDRGSHGCNRLTGWFVVDDVSFDDHELQSVTLRFEQHCNSSTSPLRGKLVLA